jgi:hypothetical protein
MGNAPYFVENPPVFFRQPRAARRRNEKEDEEGGAISLISLTLVLQWTNIEKEDGSIQINVNSFDAQTISHNCQCEQIEAWENEKLDSMSKQ